MTRITLFRCPRCGLLGEKEAENNLVQEWTSPTGPDDDGYRESFFHDCVAEDDLPRVEEVQLVEITANPFSGLPMEIGRLRGFADATERGVADPQRIVSELRLMADRLEAAA